jgi:hypothetical protein
MVDTAAHVEEATLRAVAQTLASEAANGSHAPSGDQCSMSAALAAGGRCRDIQPLDQALNCSTGMGLPM